MNKDVQCGRGYDASYSELMELLNTSFGFTEPEEQFLGLLPKLYREEYRPQDNNYIVAEDGVPVAAVGAYDHTLAVCGHSLKCRGIGNVAVHPDYRSKGYMRIAMDMSLKDMISDGIAISTLGGHRRRYQYFGYDKTGVKYTYTITKNNIRHMFGNSNAQYTVREITAPDDPSVDLIFDLNGMLPIQPIRPREKYLDIANSWRSRLLGFFEDERFVGYCILDKHNCVSEIQVTNGGELMGAVMSLYAYVGNEYKIALPPHQIAYRRVLESFAENITQTTSMSYNILDYRAVIEAFLDLKLSYTVLPDGEMTLLIHGFAGDENIRVSIKDGRSSVEYTESDTYDFEFSHLDAMSFLFSLDATIREQASPLARLWFPLPICMFSADKV